MKYYITYKTWNKKTDTIETVKHDFEKSFNSLLDFFNFLDSFKSANCIYNDQIKEIGSAFNINRLCNSLILRL
jgi:hypothetical protein